MSVSADISVADVVVLVGNPAPASRTSAVAKVVAEGLAGKAGESLTVVELAELGAGLLSSEDECVFRAQELVAGARLLVVATPVYKASFSGVLKVFLEGLEPTALESTVVVPVVVSASSAHGALADLQLRIVLQAVGGLLPVPSFLLEEHHFDHLPQYVAAWRQRFGPVVGAVVNALRPEEATVR
jgi:FMN reductase